MSARLAAVVLAHDDPPKVRRLLEALEGMDVFLHCDASTPDGLVRAMLAGAGPRVVAVPRRRTTLYSWSLVEAELAGLRLAVQRTGAEHVIVMSGACYPLVSVAELEDELSRWRGLTRMRLDPIPHEAWSTPRNHDGGLWRFRRRYVTLRGQLMWLGGVPLRAQRRAIPRELRLHASSQWKIYARGHAAALLAALDDRPDLVRFWSTTFVPDESCAASILQSPELVGPIVEEVRDDLPWLIEWPEPERRFHPRWLGEQDFGLVEAEHSAQSRHPDDTPKCARDRDRFRKLFARKVSSRATRLLDRIDSELRAV
jgi:Core-2/I-Branching enzyme